MYEFIKNVHGAVTADQLLRAKDNEGHTAMDWAADSGDINCVEYLLRRGVSPLGYDNKGRGPLFWAVKSYRAQMAKFLVQACGCDPHFADTETGQTPYMIASKSNDVELLEALQTPRFSSLISCLGVFGSRTRQSLASRRSQRSEGRRPPEEGRASEGVLLSSGDSKSKDSGGADEAVDEIAHIVNAIYQDEFGIKRCLAVPTLNETKLGNALIYGLVVGLVWFLDVFVPFWIWAILVAGLGYLYR